MVSSVHPLDVASSISAKATASLLCAAEHDVLACRSSSILLWVGFTEYHLTGNQGIPNNEYAENFENY